MAKSGIRKALTLGLSAVGIGAVVLSAVAAWSLAHRGGGYEDFVWVIVGAFLVLGALWALFAILDSHFDDLERLRANILVAAVADDARLPAPHPDFPPSPENARLRAAVAALIDKRIGPGMRPSARLLAVLSTLDEGIVVMTDSGQIRLVNQAA